MANTSYSRSKISKQTEEENLNSDVVRILACLGTDFPEDAIQKVYASLKLYQYELPLDRSILKKQNILVYCERTSWWYSNMQVNPKMWLKILTNIPEDSYITYFRMAENLCSNHYSYSYNNNLNGDNVLFLKAFYMYLKGISGYEATLKSVSNITIDNSCLHYNVWQLLQVDKTGKFALKVKPEVKKNLMSIISSIMADFLYEDADGTYKPLFSYSSEISSSDKTFYEFLEIVYMFHAEVFTGKNIDILCQQHNSPHKHLMLKAYQSLVAGDPKPMWGTLEILREEIGEVIFSYPIIALLYAACLLVAKDNGNPFKVKAALKKKIASESLALAPVIEYVEKGSLESSKKNVAEKLSLEGHSLVFVYLAKLFQFYKTPAEEPERMNKIIKQYVPACADFIKLLFSQVSDTYKPMRNDLEKKLNLKPILADRERKESWELLLDGLLAKFNAGSALQSDERIAYRVFSNNKSKSLSVQPILQKFNSKTCTWSNGRVVALDKFRKGMECMTEQDRSVAARVKVIDNYGGITYSVEPFSAMMALAGHPNVLYTSRNDSDVYVKADVRNEALQVSVARTVNGSFKVNTNLEGCISYNNNYVDISKAPHFRVIHVSKEQAEVLDLLNLLPEVPPSGKDKLLKFLENLSSSVTVMTDLLQNSNMKQIEGDNKIVVQFVPEGMLMNVMLLVKPLGSEPPYLSPGEGMGSVCGVVNGDSVQAHRDFNKETANRNAVVAAFENTQALIETNDANSWQVDMGNVLPLIDIIMQMSDKASIEWPEGEMMRLRKNSITPSSFSNMSVHSMSDWFELSGDVRLDENHVMKIGDLLALMREGGSRFVKVDDKEYMRISEQLARVLKDMARIAEHGKKSEKFNRFSASLLKELETMGVQMQLDNSFSKLMENIKNAGDMPIRLPAKLNAELRPYQREGYEWMTRLASWGAGACLADDMGLGKTIQAITLLLSRASKGAQLVVVPTNVVMNWKAELERFAPKLNVLLFNKAGENRDQMVNDAKKNDVVIMSYGLLSNEQDSVCAKKWLTVVLDEAHLIKNRETKMSKSVMELKANFKIILTGTPIQNRLSEIWNLFRFINPGLLGSFDSFSNRFINPIEKFHNTECQATLKRLISPFILRRNKNEVAKELPPKTEIQIKVNLTQEEMALYENLRRDAMALVLEGTKQSAIQALAELTKLRQAACHPQLINKELKIESSKTAQFMELVLELIENGHRTLAFSQFTSHLALVRKKLDEAGIKYLYLDGTMAPKQRAELVDAFQNGDAPLFLISLKAGGLGLNLTAADYVIHLDPWWNPAIEDQASDRSYRIGQQKPVTVYRLIAANTIEEKILRLHTHKQSLADALLEGADMSARMTRDDILNLLREK